MNHSSSQQPSSSSRKQRNYTPTQELHATSPGDCNSTLLMSLARWNIPSAMDSLRIIKISMGSSIIFRIYSTMTFLYTPFHTTPTPSSTDKPRSVKYPSMTSYLHIRLDSDGDHEGQNDPTWRSLAFPVRTSLPDSPPNRDRYFQTWCPSPELSLAKPERPKLINIFKH
jgi:hypothetical protein